MQPEIVRDRATVPRDDGDVESFSRLAEALTAYERCATISSFDNTERVPALLSRPERYKQLFTALSTPGVISRGAGLTYCLASASAQGRSILSSEFNRFLAFDEGSKIVRVEPGVTMGALFEFAVARNLLPPVLPGYPRITVGGAVAMNIHGKNQYRTGNFGDHVKNISLYHPSWGEINCGPEVNPGLFRLTVGGFGLTGHFTSVDIALTSLPGRSATLERHKVNHLVEAGDLMERLSAKSDYTYSWHNLNLRGPRFGAGTVYVEYHSNQEILASGTSCTVATIKPLPFQVYNRLTVPLLCRAYQVKERIAPRTKRSDLYNALFTFVGKEIYFRLYGKTGFRGYQILFPRENWEEACLRVANAVQQSRTPIMVASVKVFRGKRSMLNFSGSGFSLALETPNTPSSVVLFAHLDKIALDLGGIAYISRDGLLSAETVRAMYGDHYEEFRSALRDYDPEQHFQSELRKRLDV